LEVNSQVWSPHLLKDIRRLEAVQRRFTKKLSGLQAFLYTERLKLLGLERYVEVRRIRADLLFVYKLLFGFTALRAGMSCLVTLILHVLILLSADLLVLI